MYSKSVNFYSIKLQSNLQYAGKVRYSDGANNLAWLNWNIIGHDIKNIAHDEEMRGSVSWIDAFDCTWPLSPTTSTPPARLRSPASRSGHHDPRGLETERAAPHARHGRRVQPGVGEALPGVGHQPEHTQAGLGHRGVLRQPGYIHIYIIQSELQRVHSLKERQQYITVVHKDTNRAGFKHS